MNRFSYFLLLVTIIFVTLSCHKDDPIGCGYMIEESSIQNTTKYDCSFVINQGGIQRIYLEALGGERREQLIFYHLPDAAGVYNIHKLESGNGSTPKAEFRVFDVHNPADYYRIDNKKLGVLSITRTEDVYIGEFSMRLIIDSSAVMLGYYSDTINVSGTFVVML